MLGEHRACHLPLCFWDTLSHCLNKMDGNGILLLCVCLSVGAIRAARLRAAEHQHPGSAQPSMTYHGGTQRARRVPKHTGCLWEISRTYTKEWNRCCICTLSLRHRCSGTCSPISESFSRSPMTPLRPLFSGLLALSQGRLNRNSQDSSLFCFWHSPPKFSLYPVALQSCMFHFSSSQSFHLDRRCAPEG